MTDVVSSTYTIFTDEAHTSEATAQQLYDAFMAGPVYMRMDDAVYLATMMTFSSGDSGVQKVSLFSANDLSVTVGKNPK